MSRHPSTDEAVQRLLLTGLVGDASRAVATCDPTGRLNWTNAGVETLVGLTSDAVVGQDLIAWLGAHGVDDEGLERLGAALAEGRGARWECPLIASDGRRLTIDLSLGPAREPDGRLTGFVVLLLDVTEQARVRARQRAMLAEAIEAFPAGFVIYDEDDRLVTCNSAFRQLYARSAPSLTTGTTFEAIVRYGVAHGQYPQAGDSPQTQEAWVQGRLRTHRETDTDTLVQLDGDRWLQIRERRTADGLTVGVRSDVTALKRAQHELQTSQFKLQSLFDLAPVGIVLTRLDDGALVDCNQALLTMLDYTREQIESLDYWAVTPVSYRAQERAQVMALREQGRYGPYEKQMIRRDGTRVPVLVSGLSIRDYDGRTLVWSIVQDITQRKTMEAALEAAARTDRLTGLANRTALVERLDQVVRQARHHPERRFSVLFLDFDRFKMINDTLGHPVGDALLCQIAERLRRTLRASDFAGPGGGNLVARLGGDEFVLLLSDAGDLDAAQAVARRLLDVLSRTYSVNGHEIHSTASIGIVLGDEHTPSADALLRDADIAMYEAKHAGRGRAVVFNPQMHLRLTRRHEVETCLRHAIGTSQLSLVYQPIVDLDSGAIVSVEALARWQHPQLGVVSPAEFIPIAEDSGLILPLGEWTIREACRQFMAWRAADPQAAPAAISVNLSRVQMSPAETLRDLLLDVLATTGMPAQCLQLEVTEREVMRDPIAARRLMNELRELGVRLAMDDFGTGTSSLGCLRDFPFDTIKIDRSFLNELESNADVLALVQATLTLLDNLGRASVAEGVESAAQLAVLQSLGCRYAQGYHLSRPLAPAEVLARVREAISLA